MTESTQMKVSIIGGGRMGCGIAFIFLAHGHDAAIFEPSEARRNVLTTEIDSLAHMLEVGKGRLGAFSVSDNMPTAVSGAELVIEAVPERLELKQSIFEQLDNLTPPATILASNTSAIPINKIADRAKHKERIIGAHFWNPPHLIEIVELIKGDASAEGVVERAMEIFESVNMTPVRVNKDVPGFIGNRLQHALKREAIAIVAQGICDAQTVDIVTKKSFGARLPVMGTLEQSDLIGLELTKSVHDTLMPDLDTTAEPHPYLVGLIEEGKIGAKVGEGFRKWTDEEADAARNRLSQHLIEAAKPRYKSS